MSAGTAGNRWVKKIPASRILEVDPETVEKIAQAAGVRFRDLPGLPRQYWREDVERVATEAMRDPSKATEVPVV